MVFTWDETKNKLNKKQHEVSFEEAESVFLDDSIELKLLVMVHVYRESNELIRIISARKATAKERKFYKRQEPETQREKTGCFNENAIAPQKNSGDKDRGVI